MPRRRKTRPRSRSTPARLPATGIDVETSLLDVVDHVLNKGVVLNGDLVLGVANVDLIYARLSVLLSALDKIGAGDIFRPIQAPKKRKRRK